MLQDTENPNPEKEGDVLNVNLEEPPNKSIDRDEAEEDESHDEKKESNPNNDTKEEKDRKRNLASILKKFTELTSITVS